MGATTVKLAHAREEQDAAGAGYRNQITWAGASYQATPALDLTLAFYHSRYSGPVAAEGKRDLLLFGASYALSKRTNLYAEFDLNRYQGALLPASGQDRQRGASAGINHLF
jgi:predicted porin